MERVIARAGIIAVLLLLSPTAFGADDPARRDTISMDVHALSIRIAVGICHQKGFAYYMRLGIKAGICLKSDLGVENQVIDVEAYLAQSPAAAMNGRRGIQ